jgi:hypothetical protein
MPMHPVFFMEPPSVSSLNLVIFMERDRCVTYVKDGKLDDADIADAAERIAGPINMKRRRRSALI